MRLPPRHTKDIVEQTVTSAGYDPALGKVVIETGSGRFEYLPGDPVQFPRRDDGAVYDWRLAAAPPKAMDVYPGDYLPSPDGDTEQMAQELDIGRYTAPQVVKSLRVAMRGSVPYVELTCMHPTALFRRYSFALGEEVAFPREQANIGPKGIRAEGSGKLEFFGPYEHVETGALFVFARHPYGRGRWPAGVLEFDPQAKPRSDGEPHRMRFPARDWDPALKPSSPGLPVGHVKGPSRNRSSRWFEGEQL